MPLLPLTRLAMRMRQPCSGTTNRVRYGVRDAVATAWTLQTVEAAGFVDASIGFAVTEAGDALIAFQQDDKLKIVR